MNMSKVSNKSTSMNASVELGSLSLVLYRRAHLIIERWENSSVAEQYVNEKK